jgi:hypothetical protein
VGATFRGSDNTKDLAAAFRQAVERFIEAMTRAGVQVPISATYRPVARAWLMHWCWQVKHGADPAVVPPLDGVDTPRTGMNAKLIAIGASYGVKKFIGGARDKPHWSATGR